MKHAFILIAAIALTGSFASAQATPKASAKGKVASKLPAKAKTAQATPAGKKGAPAPAAQQKVASAPVGQAPAGAAGGRGLASVSDSNSALEVRGQSRNLSMMLTLRNRKNDINFVKPRENYSSEIQNTSY